jgi:hypothetical protein
MDTLDEYFAAWRRDIESVEFPTWPVFEEIVECA